MDASYEGKQIVGMDVHRRRSVLVRMAEAGERLESTRITNDPEYLREVMSRAGEAPEVMTLAGSAQGCSSKVLNSRGLRMASVGVIGKDRVGSGRAVSSPACREGAQGTGDVGCRCWPGAGPVAARALIG